MSTWMFDDCIMIIWQANLSFWFSWMFSLVNLWWCYCTIWCRYWKHQVSWPRAQQVWKRTFSNKNLLNLMLHQQVAVASGDWILRFQHMLAYYPFVFFLPRLIRNSRVSSSNLTELWYGDIWGDIWCDLTRQLYIYNFQSWDFRVSDCCLLLFLICFSYLFLNLNVKLDRTSTSGL